MDSKGLSEYIERTLIYNRIPLSAKVFTARGKNSYLENKKKCKIQSNDQCYQLYKCLRVHRRISNVCNLKLKVRGLETTSHELWGHGHKIY
jgi:hypothetical protein